VPIPERPEPDAPRWRVEELARRAELSVDTVRFYQKRRLLPAPDRRGRLAWYGPEHLDRLARIRDLRREGLTLALIGRVLAGDLDPTDRPLAAAVVSAVADGDALLTLDDLARRSDVPLPLLETAVEEGLLVPRLVDGEPRFTAADAAVVSVGVGLLQQGLPMPDLLALARAHHDATHEVAERAVALFDEHVRRPLRATDLPDAVKAERLVEAFRAILPAVTTLVTHHFRRVLLSVAQSHLESVGEEHELAAAGEESLRIEARLS
jgi:DNA-binding transcriptional MerR regulator